MHYIFLLNCRTITLTAPTSTPANSYQVPQVVSDIATYMLNRVQPELNSAMKKITKK
jgi:hypothetical protein